MDIVDIFEEMITTGQPPNDNCSLLGVGYDEALKRLEKVYLYRGFERGKSAEKFIIGPYGSGKTHFLRQLLERGRQIDCVTAEVPLSRDVDISKPLLVYKEVAREIRAPGQQGKGLKNLLRNICQKLRAESEIEDPNLADDYLQSRIDAFDDIHFEDEQFRKVAARTLKADLRDEYEIYENGCRWLSGEVNEKLVAKSLGVGRIPVSEQDSYGRRALLCLCQFAKTINYRGTIIGFDEAEQAINVPRKKVQRILSMARAEIDSISRVKNAAVMIVYAFTPDVVQGMQAYPALQQRLAEPDPENRFFDGNSYSPRIELDQIKLDSLEFLEQISEHLINLFYTEYGNKLTQFKEDILVDSRDWAEEISARSPSISNRREIVKLTCSKLLQLYGGNFDLSSSPNPGDAEV